MPASAQRFELDSAGVRAGFSANRSGAAFHQVDAELNANTPWSWDLGGDWWLKVQGEASAGWLGDPGHNAFIASVGPCAVLGHNNLPVSLDGGMSPTFLGHPDFGTKNFGGNAQFTTHAGVNVDIGCAFRVSYRFQHMSNAGLDVHNPGLNLHVFGVSYRF